MRSQVISSPAWETRRRTRKGSLSVYSNGLRQPRGSVLLLLLLLFIHTQMLTFYMISNPLNVHCPGAREWLIRLSIRHGLRS